MIAQILRQFWRNLVRKPLFSLITFTGFTLGIAAAIVIYLWIVHELSFEKFHPDHELIYRVLTVGRKGQEIDRSAGSYRPLAKSLKETFPVISDATYLSYSSEDSPLQLKSGGPKIEVRRARTNEDFFKVFQGFEFLEGDPESAFANPSNIVITEQTCNKLFGNEPALGKTVISDKYGIELLQIGGVIRIPEESHINFGFLQPEWGGKYANLASSWTDKAHVRTYIKLGHNARLDRNTIHSMRQHLMEISPRKELLEFQHITDIHLHTNYPTYLYDQHIGHYRYLWIFSGLALLIIIMASLNFSILSVASSTERSIEIGIRKVSGADKRQIIVQFVGEALLQTVAATLIGLGLVGLLMPWINTITGEQFSLSFTTPLIIALLLIVVLVGVLSGLYPAFWLSSLKPVRIFSGNSKGGGSAAFIHWLVTIQFIMALMFIIATFMVMKQSNFIRTKDLGLNRENIVVVPTGLWYKNQSFLDELLQDPRILSASASSYAPVDFGWKLSLPVFHGDQVDTLLCCMMWADQHFDETYQLEVLQGKFLETDFHGYWKAIEDADSLMKAGADKQMLMPAVINETAAKRSGFEDPVGQKIGNFIIAGIVRDFHYRPLQHTIDPLMITYDPQNIMTLSIRIAPENQQNTIQTIREIYQKHRNNRAFNYQYFEDMLQQNYLEELRLKNLTLFFATIALIIALLGMLGMTVLSLQKHTREIGIRKANGASFQDILWLFNKRFLRYVAIAFVVAVPLSWLLLNRWLEEFAYRTSMNWWVFVLAGLLVTVLASLTISWQTSLVATKNPSNTLRYE